MAKTVAPPSPSDVDQVSPGLASAGTCVQWEPPVSRRAPAPDPSQPGAGASPLDNERRL
ncbi:MAG: hypothetical protein AAFQ67_01250 [Pseudomonadota bacterium]